MDVPYSSSVSLNFSSDGPRFSVSEVTGANWISKNYVPGIIIALDSNRWVLLNSRVGVLNSKKISTIEELSSIRQDNSYLFVDIYNIKNDLNILKVLNKKQRYMIIPVESF